MKKISAFLMVNVFFVLFISCSSADSKYMCFDQVVYISDFPRTIFLKKTDPLDVDLMGCVDFVGNDSLLVFKMMGTDYHWQVCSFTHLNKGVNLLKKGMGPDEFVNMPSNEYFQGTGCRVWMSGEGQMGHINLSKSFQQGSLCLDTLYRLPINGMAVNCISIRDSIFFAVLYQYNSFHRILFNQRGDRKILKHLQSINEVTIHNDLNSISAVRRYEPARNKVVEGMLHLNQINLYSLEDSTFAKTICVGDKLSNLSSLDNTSKKIWKKYYSTIVTHPDYFAAIYFNAQRKDFFDGKLEKVNIQFFNWEGEPLLNLIVPYSAETFFIHKNKDLYLLSVHGEKEYLYKYDLETLLNEIIGC